VVAASHEVTFCDELEFAFGWIHPDPSFMLRAAHAVRAQGRIWLIDPIDGDGVDERIRALGEPAGVVRLLDRHPRDCEAFAARYGVPLHREPRGGVGGAPFEVVSVVRIPRWTEVALWFPDERTLVCADALANAPGYRAPGEPVGVHPFLRLRPPRILTTYPAEHLLLGHGPGLHGPQTPAAIRRAMDTAWRQTPPWAFAQVRAQIGRLRG
jgi:hypothetical protein